ncbi:MAG: HNH endonuclease [Planctomycetaceae bacterium]|nr:HNH endonuclease [Planctomycetaceae bacterium]
MHWRQRKSVRRELLAVDPHCGYCRIPLTLQTSTIDHKIPLSQGGPDDPSNFRLACRRCNRRKGGRTVDEFLRSAPSFFSRYQPRQRQPFDYAGRLWLQEAADELHRLLAWHGNLLTIVRLVEDVRSRLTEDTFREWVAAEFGWTDQTLRRWRRVAVTFAAVRDDAPHSQWRAYYQLVQTDVPSAAIAETIAQLNAGHSIQLAGVRRLIERHRNVAAGLNRQQELSHDEEKRTSHGKYRWLQLFRDRRRQDKEAGQRACAGHPRSA